MRMRRLYGMLGVAALAACGGAAPMVSIGPPPPHGVASVRLFDQNLDVTSHIPLVIGVTDRIEVRLYAPDGSQVASIAGDVAANFTFTPTSLASSVRVTGQPLARDVTPTARTGEGGQLYVSLLFLSDSTTRSFGPFDARSEEHTSELQSQSNLVCRLLLEKKKKRIAHLLVHAQPLITI